MQERRHTLDWIALRFVEDAHGVFPHVVRVPSVLLAAHLLEKLGIGHFENPRSAHHFERTRWDRCLHRLEPLFAHPFRAHFSKGVERAPERGLGFGLQLELEGRNEARTPQNSEPVLPEALARVANRAQELSAHVGEPVEGVHELTVHRVVGDGVDGEIATREVLDDISYESDVIRTAPV